MGAKTKEIGGGPATGLAEDWVKFLGQFIGADGQGFNTGGLGPAGSPSPTGTSTGIMGVLSDILSGGGGKEGSAIATLLSKQQERDVNALRARFTAGGGVSGGTPAAFAEGLYRAEAAPRITDTITRLQLSTIFPLLEAISGTAGKGITQRQIVQKPGLLSEILTPVAGIAGAALPFLNPAFAAVGAAGGGGGGGGNVFGAASNYSFDQNMNLGQPASLQGYFE